MDYFHAKRFLDTLPDWEKGEPPPGKPEDYLPRMRALLRRLGDPQARFNTIIVGGTNGKGTIASLLAALLQAGGHRVGLYSSPHLHTLRERIQLNGRLLDKDAWAEGVQRLYESSRDFSEEGLGGFTRYEALTGLAAAFFAAQQVTFAVFEVGLGGRFDAANAWDADMAILGPVALDHTDVLGDDLVGIAADKIRIARPHCPLITTAGQTPLVLDYIRRHSSQAQIKLFVVDAEGFTDPDGRTDMAFPALPERPRVYRENARLALAAAALVPATRLEVGRHLKAMAPQVLAQHQWPGRFERAQEKPLVILDGAHNPSAGHALVAELALLTPRWTFVIGVTAGHDATAMLQALQPIADKIFFSATDHPKAVAPDALAACAPKGLVGEVMPFYLQAFERALKDLGPDDALCITGSLYMVARAREYFNLPYERESINEDVALESLECLKTACLESGVDFRPVSANGQVVQVMGSGRPLFFLRNKNPFNDYVSAHLAEDKGYQYELFTQAGLLMPQTVLLFNPLADERFNRYKTHRSVEDMAVAVEAEFSFPLLVKKNRSSVSQGVYLERDGAALRQRLQELFENSGYSDNVVLVQDYVRGPEYRIVASQGELLLAYRKEGSPGVSDLNPLHGPDGQAVKVEDPSLLDNMRWLTAALAQSIDLGFYAIDLIAAADGLYVLEVNPNPFCYFYNRSNGREDFVGIYKYLLRKYV
jgi:dihydrofolate synthase/folylpolyglutamate synthase